MNEAKYVGIDLAKNVFQLHGANALGKVEFRKRLMRDQLPQFVAALNPCVIAMKACASAHDWARRFQAMGHEVRLISPQFVKPFVKGNKTDGNDAEGICDAVRQKNMRFVPIKTVEQQDIQSLHRIRSRLVSNRTGLVCQMRGILLERGFTCGVSARDFKNGRHFAAWLGLVPKQRSSGNKVHLLGISKRGDKYLRTLLVHGARAVLRTAATKTTRFHQWALEVALRRGAARAIVAVANKMARMIWVLMAKGEIYKPA